MSLVAYGNSDDSEDENSDTPNVEHVTKKPKKQHETARISIPSLKEFSDEEDSEKISKKEKPKKGVGLFSILPPPKHSSATGPNLTPHSVAKRSKPKSSSNSPNPSRFKTTTQASSLDEADAECISSANYFSLDFDNTSFKEKDGSLVDDSVGNVLFSTLPKPSASHSISSYYPLEESAPISYDTAESSIEVTGPQFDEQCVADSTFSSISQDLLNDKEFLKIKGKHRREEINIIDVNAADQLMDKEKWLMQSLTEEKVHRPSKRRGEMPTQQQKRKHQITYLAFQAKEREQDLKNQWSQNNRSRRETQAKYGF